MLDKPRITPKHEGPGQPVPEEPGDPDWTMPPPPEFGARVWFIVILERFGFWIACGLTLVAIAYLYINADRVSSKEPAPGPIVAGEQQAPAPDPGRSPDALTMAAGEPDAPAAGVPVSVTTDPAGAAIFVNGAYMGASPLQDVALAEGRYLISVLKPDYAQLDTVVTLSDASALIQLTLQKAGEGLVADAAEMIPPETPATPDEAAREEPPATPASASPEPVSPSDAAQATRESTPPPGDAAETPPADEPPADAEEPPAEAKEQPAIQAGELQVNSEPSGASVLVAGQEVGVTPVLLTGIEAGAQPVLLRREGYEDFSTIVDVVAGQRNTVNGQLKQRLGTLKILVKPWGNIYIDGALKKEESTIWYVTQLPPGNHRVRVEHPALGKWEQVVVVAAGEENAITIDYNKIKSDSQ